LWIPLKEGIGGGGGRRPKDRMKRGLLAVYFNKASINTRALPIERFKIMEKEIDIFENLLMTINSVMDGK
jgi:hypothetical protein